MLSLPGKITVAEAPELWASLLAEMDTIQSEGLDANDVEEVDTAALQVFLELKKRDIVLHNPSDSLKSLCESYCLDVLETK